MKHLIFATLTVFVGVLFLHAGDSPGDLEMMQGLWEIVSLVEKGKEVPAKEIEALEVVILKEKFAVIEKGKPQVEYSIKIDPTKTPKAIDFTHDGGESKGKTEPGIYTFEKGFLRLILDEDRKGRPTVFAGKETASYSVMLLKKKSK